MTRSTMNAKLRLIYLWLGIILAISLIAKLGAHIPGIGGTKLVFIANDIYDYMKDMALIFITVVAAYLANVFQKRSTFVTSLEREWRRIVRTKSTLYAFCENRNSSEADYMNAFCQISETLDNMRIVYKNVGETDKLIGLYPYNPLHDMRRALMTLDPRKHPDISPAHRKLVRDAVLQSFYALRENFLEELDLEQPTHPLLVSGGRRLKKSGATFRAHFKLKRQFREQSNGLANGEGPESGKIGTLLAKLRRAEKSDDAAKEKPSPAPDAH